MGSHRVGAASRNLEQLCGYLTPVQVTVGIMNGLDGSMRCVRTCGSTVEICSVGRYGGWLRLPESYRSSGTQGVQLRCLNDTAARGEHSS